MGQSEVAIGFTCREYLGTEIVRDLETMAPITDRESLREGDVVYATWLEGGYIPLIVERDESERFIGKSRHLFAPLRFGEDDRKCWVAIGFINMKALEKLTRTRE